MSRALDDLDPAFRVKAMELIARAAEVGIPVMIVNTLRSQHDQDVNLAAGVSWTKHSKHLADAQGKAHAIDLCPYAIFQEHGPDKLAWDATDPAWPRLAAIAQGLGLRCGFMWTQKDCGHYEDPA